MNRQKYPRKEYHKGFITYPLYLALFLCFLPMQPACVSTGTTQSGYPLPLKDNTEPAKEKGKYSPFPDNKGKDRERFAILSLSDNLENGAVSCFSLFELSIELDAWIGNPYDPGDTGVYALFRAPDGTEKEIPGFFFVPYHCRIQDSFEILSQSGNGYWKIRFTPRIPGNWQYLVKAEQGEKKSALPWKSFKVTEKKDPGFISKKNQAGRYFRFESGMTYIPVGSNVSWYDNRGMKAYELWFSKMAENGANYARIWFAPWGFAQEWKDTGLGNYALRQKEAWQLDCLMELAEKYNIYLMLCFINHGQFSTGTNPEWDRNPYNILNGGMLKNPRDFLTDAGAKRYFKRRLRYIVSRWAYSTRIFSWELWNEINLADNMYNPENLVPWIREMTGYIEEIDPYDHLISSSSSLAVKGDEPEWQYLDYLQIHKYNTENWAPYLNRTILRILGVTGKPILVGEFGMQGNFIDPLGIHFHNGMWASLFSGSAGTGMLWWWDTYIDPDNLYYHYKGISSFFKDEVRTIGEMEPLERKQYEKMNLYFLKSKNRILCWIQDKTYSYKGFMEKAFGAGLENVSYKKITNSTIEFENILPGVYRIEQWDTQTGKLLMVKEKEYTGTAIVEVRSFTGDTALKLIKME
ncbi:MAG: DUF5060 domain-containing protein [Spirochaetales bacterium]|nr:DUF5060 domain-containing protein [Spirochaetales bacterium]